ncbi:MAG: DUF123 domain-containing protein [Candidatus Poribacteria bacterium]|nr:DUF123 domain-containing protein [Candidatus Poribacteria bacterium]
MLTNSSPQLQVTTLYAPSNRCFIAVCGGDEQSGAYLLRIRVRESFTMPYGRFKKAKPIHTPAGEYLYIGSALGSKGGAPLARRLVRHAARTGELPPHPIQQTFLQFFRSIQLGEGNLLPRNGKRLHWNVDHLLDRAEAELIGAVILRTRAKIERELGQLILNDPCASIIEKGIGANDIPGNTHLVKIEAEEAWWRQLPVKTAPLLNIGEE